MGGPLGCVGHARPVACYAPRGIDASRPQEDVAADEGAAMLLSPELIAALPGAPALWSGTGEGSEILRAVLVVTVFQGLPSCCLIHWQGALWSVGRRPGAERQRAGRSCGGAAGRLGSGRGKGVQPVGRAGRRASWRGAAKRRVSSVRAVLLARPPGRRRPARPCPERQAGVQRSRPLSQLRHVGLQTAGKEKQLRVAWRIARSRFASAPETPALVLLFALPWLASVQRPPSLLAARRVCGGAQMGAAGGRRLSALPPRPSHSLKR